MPTHIEFPDLQEVFVYQRLGHIIVVTVILSQTVFPSHSLIYQHLNHQHLLGQEAFLWMEEWDLDKAAQVA